MSKRYKSRTMEAVHETAQGLRSVDAIDDTRMRNYDDMCLEPEPNAEASLTFVIDQDNKGAWRWRLMAGDGRIVATSGEGYKSRKDCMAAITVVKSAGNAKVAA